MQNLLSRLHRIFSGLFLMVKMTTNYSENDMVVRVETDLQQVPIIVVKHQ